MQKEKDPDKALGSIYKNLFLMKKKGGKPCGGASMK